MARVQGWERILDEHVANPAPFQWGLNDCALWCASWVLKATGQDFAAEWRGRYSTEDELKMLMHSLGIDGYEQIVDGTGCPQIRPAFAQRGDVMMHPAGHLGICNGAHAHFLTENGRTRIGFTTCIKAWKVA